MHGHPETGTVHSAVLEYTTEEPGSLPYPPVLWRMTLPPNRRLCMPRVHDSVSASCS